MKKIKLLIALMGFVAIITLTESCKKEDSCPMIDCNEGTQNQENCTCDCPDGLMGANCEVVDLTKIQSLLNIGKSPIDLYNAGVPIESLYGKLYKEGLIFHLDIFDGTGLVAATEDQSTEVSWGCTTQDILGLSNVTNNPNTPETEVGTRLGDGITNTSAILTECTEDGIAAKLCHDLGPDWFLPSRGELILMYRQLHAKGFGNFSNANYWSSTEFESAASWGVSFTNGAGFGELKQRSYNIRAARVF